MYKPTTENLSQTAGADELLIASIGQIPAGSCTNKLASQNTYPSWGWWIVNGPERSTKTGILMPRDISLNRMMFGEIGAWFFKGLGGINVDETNPGFKNVLLSRKISQNSEGGNDICRMSASRLTPTRLRPSAPPLRA